MGIGREVGEIILDAETIQRRVAELAQEISRDYAGQELLLVAVLKGAVVFASDLMRRLTMPVALDFVAAASYGQGTESSGKVHLVKDLDMSVAGRHVLLVEDIVDTGLTVRCLLDLLAKREPANLRLCALLDKPSRRETQVQIDYLGFQVPDRFLVGYGLDCGERFRNLPYVAAVREEAANSAHAPELAAAQPASDPRKS